MQRTIVVRIRIVTTRNRDGNLTSSRLVTTTQASNRMGFVLVCIAGDDGLDFISCCNVSVM